MTTSQTSPRPSIEVEISCRNGVEGGDITLRPPDETGQQIITAEKLLGGVEQFIDHYNSRDEHVGLTYALPHIEHGLFLAGARSVVKQMRERGITTSLIDATPSTEPTTSSITAPPELPPIGRYRPTLRLPRHFLTAITRQG